MKPRPPVSRVAAPAVGGLVRQRVTTGVGVVLLVAIIFALNFYRLPVVALSPGPAEDVLARVKITGRTPVYESKGDLYLTSVGIDDDVRFYEALLDLANRDVQMLPRADLYPDDESPQEIDRQNTVDMDTSKMNATVVALRELGYKIEPSGTQIQEVAGDAPAAGKLRVADEILRVDGHQVHSTDEVREAIARHRPGDRVTVRVRRDHSDLDVTVATRAAGDAPGRAQIGVVLRELFDRLPVDVNIDTEGIGGPSAGLMFTLSIIDKLTKEDLTGGRRIAGTGEISLDGRVGRIGGISEKLVAARRQGATVFLVPAGNCAEARRAVPKGLHLVKVTALHDALAYLRQPPASADGPAC
jgi:Lon-like protease